MGQGKAPRSISTAYGRVDAQTLERLQTEFDTRVLLELVDELDELRARICEPDGMRAELLRLHAMAHTLVNAGPLNTSPGDASIWEMAEELMYELSSIANRAQQASSMIQPLAQLMPKGEADEED